MKKQMTNKQKDNLAIELIEMLQKDDLFEEITIYTNNKRYTSESNKSSSDNNEQKLNTKYGTYYVTNFENKKVTEIDQYANPLTLTMTFEGALYSLINNCSRSIENKLDILFAKYNLQYELDFSWSLSTWYKD